MVSFSLSVLSRSLSLSLSFSLFLLSILLPLFLQPATNPATAFCLSSFAADLHSAGSNFFYFFFLFPVPKSDLCNP
jgi:hypothetical protein